MDRAVEASGLGLQGWLANAVDQRLERQEELAGLVREAFRRFGAKCFWNVREDRPLALLVPLVMRRLKKYGGREGINLAARLEALAPQESSRWP